METSSSKFDKQEAELDKLIKENLVEGQHFEIYKTLEDGYTWKGELSNGRYIGKEFSSYQTEGDAKEVAVSYLTTTYKKLACVPPSIPIEYRDFTVEQDDPDYASWRSRGDTFGDKYREYDLYTGNVDIHDSAISYLYREYQELDLSAQPKMEFEQDKIVSMIRDSTSQSFRQAWAEKYVMSTVKAIQLEWAGSIKEAVKATYVKLSSSASQTSEEEPHIEEVRIQKYRLLLDRENKTLSLRSALDNDLIAEYNLEENWTYAHRITKSDVDRWTQAQQLIKAEVEKELGRENERERT